MSGSIDVDGVQVGYHGIKYRDARISQLEEALSELMDAVKKEVDDKPLLGWLGARLSDARDALKKKDAV